MPHLVRTLLWECSLAILDVLEPRISPRILQRCNDAVTEFSASLADLINYRRKHPDKYNDDVLSRLIAGSKGDNGLSDAQLINNCIFLLYAGHETTTNLIGNSVNALLNNPD